MATISGHILSVFDGRRERSAGLDQLVHCFSSHFLHLAALLHHI